MIYEKGLVSVVMPTYKRSEKLIRAIDSILNQTYKKIELYLVNDNEPDDEYTAELKERVAQYKSDSRFHLVIQDKHVNGAVARNIGIRMAKGEYIAFLDDDDWWMPNKIERQLSELELLPKEWGGVSCKFTQYDQNGTLVGKTKKYRDGYIYKDILNLTADVATGTLLLRREALDHTGYFDEKLLRHQDLQLLVFFTSKYKLHEVDDYLHCVDVSDTQNRPNPEKLIMHKKAFFESVKPVICTLKSSDIRCIKAMHQYELGYVYLRSGQFFKGIQCCLYVFTSVKGMLLAVKKTIMKLQQLVAK